MGLIRIFLCLLIIGSPYNWDEFYNRMNKQINKYRQDQEFIRKQQEKDMIPKIIPPQNEGR